MSKWIDADVFELHMENEWDLGEISNGEWMHFREMLNEEIGIDLVRCGECKWYGDESRRMYECCTYWAQGGGATLPTMASDFCARGERRDDD